MADTLTLLGQAYAGGDATALFKAAEGRVLTAYLETFKLTGMIQEEAVEDGRNSISFPIITNVDSKYFVRGTEAVRLEGDGQPKEDSRTIFIDRPQYAKTYIDKQDSSFKNFDIKAWHLKKIGEGLARTKEKLALQAGVLAARTAAKGTLGAADRIEGGAALAVASVHTNSDTFYTTLLDAAATLDNKNVPDTDRYVFVTPEIYNLLFIATTARNALFSRDLGGAGSLQGREQLYAAGFTIVRTTMLPKTNIASAVAGAVNTYHGDFTKTKALVLHKEALGIANQWNITLEQQKSYNPLQTELVGYTSYGIGAVNPAGAVEIAIP